MPQNANIKGTIHAPEPTPIDLFLPVDYYELERMIIDLHTHTKPWSEDSYLTPGELIGQAKKVGLDGICLTEHDWFWTAEKVAEFTRGHDFLVLPGVEITTEEGHLLVFGLEKYVFGMHRAQFVKRLVDEVGGAIIVAHPYRREFPMIDPDYSGFRRGLGRACEKSIYEVADAIEVLNGRASEKEIIFSREVGRILNLKGVGASDAHELKDIGSCATEFEREIRNLQDLVTELKAGRFKAVNLRTGYSIP